MTKRIWFVQQRPFGYAPLKAGLGLITEEELKEYGIFNGTQCHEAILKTHQLNCKSLTDIGYNPDMLCPKTYTTRPHKLKGTYHVVEGSRFAPHPLEPRIEFEAVCRGQLDLRNKTLDGSPLLSPDRFAQADLGISNVTFDTLVNVIIKLNKNHTIDTPFYAHRLLPIKTDIEIEQREKTMDKKSAQELPLAMHGGKAMEQSQITEWVVA